jgi:hypothetical protein
MRRSLEPGAVCLKRASSSRDFQSGVGYVPDLLEYACHLLDREGCQSLCVALAYIPDDVTPAQPFALTAVFPASSRFRLGCMPRRDCIVYLDVKKLRRQ